MRKGEIAIWACLTVLFAWLLFALVMPASNNAKNSGDMERASALLLLPALAQLALLVAGAVYSLRKGHREPVLGILCGFGLEFAGLAVIVLMAASAHY